MRRPDDPEPEPEGGRAAERLREFLAEHLPPGEVESKARKVGLQKGSEPESSQRDEAEAERPKDSSK